MARSARVYTYNPKVRPSVEDLRASLFVLPEDIPDAIQKDPIARQNYQSFWVDFIFEHYEGFKLLICCSAGSVLRHQVHDEILEVIEGDDLKIEAVEYVKA